MCSFENSKDVKTAVCHNPEFSRVQPQNMCDPWHKVKKSGKITECFELYDLSTTNFVFLLVFKGQRTSFGDDLLPSPGYGSHFDDFGIFSYTYTVLYCTVYTIYIHGEIPRKWVFLWVSIRLFLRTIGIFLNQILRRIGRWRSSRSRAWIYRCTHISCSHNGRERRIILMSKHENNCPMNR